MILDDIKSDWDVVVIGGGITGAGIFNQAAAMGLSVLLAEQRDYAWGTSSRSSKMVHGGLRYLKQGRLLMTRNSVKERQRMLLQEPGLVEPLTFLMPIYKGQNLSAPMMEAGLVIYSLMAMKKQYRRLTSGEVLEKVPQISDRGLVSGFCFQDAQVDDARLVLSQISRGIARGGVALNYTRIAGIGRNRQGNVSSVTLEDTDTGLVREVKARLVINATGAWAEKLHPSPVKGLSLRPLRGSHLIFPGHVLPMGQVLNFMHPRDQRPVFIFPWEGSAVLGTTDVDHHGSLDREPSITAAEAAYLMEGLHHAMPGAHVSLSDSIASFAGVRPVLSRGRSDASGESREHCVWKNKGLITVTGGKMTTFRLLARDALRAGRPYFPGRPKDRPKSCFQPAGPLQALQTDSGILPPGLIQRLWGRYGSLAGEIAGRISRDSREGDPIGNTAIVEAELYVAARHEQVRHLDDLMLRRVRLGLLLPQGGRHVLDRVKPILCRILAWDEHGWEREKNRYLDIWQRYYAPLP
ncbi:MAG: glycerol-3-phosphate dehydrogenase/oxidase [Pseudomonadota bacterium]